MMKKLLSILAIVFVLLACNNDESVKSLNLEDPAFGVVGRWYAENNSDNPILNMYGEYVFTADGTIYIDEYRRINGYRRNELVGTYTVNNNNITTGFGLNEGGQSTYPLKVTDGLTFSASFRRFGGDYELTFQRIIGEIILMTDSTKNVTKEIQQIIEAYTSKPVEIKSYSMNDDAIASVNNDGLLLAKLMGVTYLMVETSIGTAVVKVSVSAKENLWNDFSLGIGKNFNDIEKLYGKHYAFKNDSLIRYYYDNPYVDSVEIFKHDDITDSIVVSFQADVNNDSITNFLKRKNMVPVNDTKERFTNSSNPLLASLSARNSANACKLIYTRFDPNWDDRICDYKLTYEELKSKYGRGKFYNGSQASYDVKNDFVTNISYFFDSKGEVEKYSFYVNMDIDQSLIVDFLNKKFFYQDPSYPYVRNFQYKGKEMLNYVSIDSGNNHNLHYRFKENK